MANIKNQYQWIHRAFILLPILSLMIACDDLSDVGNQTDSAPVASAVVVGARASDSASTNEFTVRAGTDVLLSGKDSSGIDDPILGFEWSQTDNSGYSVTLVERSSNSRVFTAPIVSVNTNLSFRLTVKDADGKTSTDTLIVTVTPVNDVNAFLSHPDNNEAILNILVAPDFGETTGISVESFDINIEVIAHWRNRDGDYDSIPISTEVLTGTFPANYVAPVDPTASTNPRILFPLPNLNIDLINQNFEDENRQKRLEAYQIDSAYLGINLTLEPKTTTVAFKAYAFDGTDLIVANEITTASISGDTEFRRLAASASVKALSVASTSDEAVLLDTVSSSFSVNVFMEELKEQIGVDNVQTGRNYYKLIDPTDQFVNLSDWLVYAGFTDVDRKNISDVNTAHAVYLNNYDLGFGRDMWTRYDETTGNVYSYVINYPSLEAAVKGVGDFAVVVMEYSGYPNTDDPKIVKFYAYVPDDRTGGYMRASTMNFDGRGEKTMPNVCAACHYQDPTSVGSKFTEVADADIGATFLPWDLDSFLYSNSSIQSEIDPSYNSNNIGAENNFDASRTAQEPELKKMNQHALNTYTSDPARHDASIKLLHCMYGDSSMTGVVGELPANNFDRSCVQEGWQDQVPLYQNVYTRYCRACHTQFPESVEDTQINFDTYADFVSDTKLPLLKDYVYQQGRMPLARLTMDRFWVNYDGSTSAAETLRAHLDEIGETVDSTPGEPVANLTVTGITIADDESFPNQVNVKDIVVKYDAAASLFTENYLWEVTSEDCASLPLLNDNFSVTASFVLDSEDFFPCTFNMALTVSNDLNSIAQKHIIRATRIPTAVNFTRDMGVANDAMNTGYVSGDSEVNISVDDQIISRGDDTLTISLEGSNPNTTNNNDGTVTYEIVNPLQGLNDSFDYTVLDVDSSESNIGTINIIVPAIAASLTNQTPTASSVVLDWTVPDGFMGDSYKVLQKESTDSTYPSVPIATYKGGVFTHLASSLAPNTSYNFKVITALGSDTNESNEISISTESGKPSGLVLSNRTASTLDISWTAGSGGTPTCYNVYRGVTKVGDCVSNASPFQDSSLIANQSYSYTVLALFGSDESTASDPLNISTLAVAPSSLSVTNGTTSVGLSWNDSANAGSPQYRVYRSNSIVSTTTSDSSTVATSSNTQYGYKVCTYISSDDLEYCTAVTTLRTIATTTDIQNFNLSGSTCAGCHALTNTGLEAKAKGSACFGVSPAALVSCYSSAMGVNISTETSEIIHNWFLSIQ